MDPGIRLRRKEEHLKQLEVYLEGLEGVREENNIRAN